MMTCDGRVSEKARTDEDNNVIWRSVGEEIVSNSSKKVDVSSCCTNNTRIRLYTKV